MGLIIVTHSATEMSNRFFVIINNVWFNMTQRYAKGKKKDLQIVIIDLQMIICK